MPSKMSAGPLALASLAVLVVASFTVWSNPDGVTRGPFVGDFNEPAMLILPALGYIGATLGTALGFRRMGRGLGLAVLTLGALNTVAITALMVAAGFGAVREGLLLLEIGSLLLVASGALATFRPTRSPDVAPVVSESLPTVA